MALHPQSGKPSPAQWLSRASSTERPFPLPRAWSFQLGVLLGMEPGSLLPPWKHGTGSPPSSLRVWHEGSKEGPWGHRLCCLLRAPALRGFLLGLRGPPLTQAPLKGPFIPATPPADPRSCAAVLAGVIIHVAWWGGAGQASGEARAWRGQCLGPRDGGWRLGAPACPGAATKPGESSRSPIQAARRARVVRPARGGGKGALCSTEDLKHCPPDNKKPSQSGQLPQAPLSKKMDT